MDRDHQTRPSQHLHMPEGRASSDALQGWAGDEHKKVSTPNVSALLSPTLPEYLLHDVILLSVLIKGLVQQDRLLNLVQVSIA